jgi:hypothetical protein
MPGYPGRTLLQHEQTHVGNFEQGLADFDSYATPAFSGKWECCSCTDAKVLWASRLWDYFLWLTAERDAQLECSDYSGAEKAHACNVRLPQVTTDRLNAFAAQQRAFSEMAAKCSL